MKPTQKSDELWAKEIAAMTKDHEVHVPAKGQPDFIPKKWYTVHVAGYASHDYYAINRNKARWAAFRAFREATGIKDFMRFCRMATVERKPK